MPGKSLPCVLATICCSSHSEICSQAMLISDLMMEALDYVHVVSIVALTKQGIVAHSSFYEDTRISCAGS